MGDEGRATFIGKLTQEQSQGIMRLMHGVHDLIQTALTAGCPLPSVVAMVESVVDLHSPIEETRWAPSEDECEIFRDVQWAEGVAAALTEVAGRHIDRIIRRHEAYVKRIVEALGAGRINQPDDQTIRELVAAQLRHEEELANISHIRTEQEEQIRREAVLTAQQEVSQLRERCDALEEYVRVVEEIYDCCDPSSTGRRLGEALAALESKGATP